MMRKQGSPAGSTSGVELLARITGQNEDEMRQDGKALGRGLLAFGVEAMALVRDYASDDPAVRDAAKRRWAELNAMLPQDGAPGDSAPHEDAARDPGSAPGGLSTDDRARLNRALTKLVGVLEDAVGTERKRADR